MLFKLGLLSCFIAVCVAMENEPQCYSRFDYEYKVVQKLVELEQKQKQCDAEIQALQSFGKAREEKILYLENAHKEQVEINKELAGKNKDLEKSIETVRNETTALMSDIDGVAKPVRERKGYMSAFTVTGTPRTGSTGVLVLPEVKTNIGGHYNTSTGQFTCVYNGTYFFTVSIYKSSSSSYTWSYIKKNGIKLLTVGSNPGSSNTGGWQEGSNSIVLHLVSGDTVHLDVDKNTYRRSTFTGFLLKADD